MGCADLVREPDLASNLENLPRAIFPLVPPQTVVTAVAGVVTHHCFEFGTVTWELTDMSGSS